MEFPLWFPMPTVTPESEAYKIVPSVILQGHGTLDKVAYVFSPIPKPLEEGHVEIEVDRCGLSMTDNYLRLGIIRQSRFPVVMGSECTGTVRRTGPNADKLMVGQNVLCLKMEGGLFRRRAPVPQANCFPIPDGVESTDAVALGMNFLMAHICLFEIGHLKKNQTVFMQSIGGGVGTAVVQLAKLVEGVQVVGTASEHKTEKLKELGVGHVFRPDVTCQEEILELFPGGVDIVINSNGGTDIDECLQLLRPFGKLIIIGSNSTVTYPRAASGLGLRKPVWDLKDVSTSRLIANNCCIAGINLGDYIDRCPQKVSKILDKIFTLYKEKKIKPVIDSIHRLDNVRVAFERLCTRVNVGKVLLKIRPQS